MRWPTTAKHARSRLLVAARAAGLVAILGVALRGSLAYSPRMGGAAAVFCGTASIAAIFWLAITGGFGYAGLGRRDWVGLIPFLAALVLREGFTLHSVQEIEIQFARGPVGRHSVVYPLLQMFFMPLVSDPHVFTMHMNGVLGACACLGMYAFVRQRAGSRRAGFLCAWFLALHPVVTRFSPTDGPYSLVLATWLGGLALLSTPELDFRALIGGAALLGIAASARIEGPLFLVASLIMLDCRKIFDAAARHRRATLIAFLLVYVLGAVQMYLLLPGYFGRHGAGPWWVSWLPGSESWSWWFEDAVREWLYNPPALAALIGLGIVAGFWKRYRLGLRAYLAVLVVVAPVAGSWHAAVTLHRMTPTYGLQAMIAGMGALALCGWIPLKRRWDWLAVVPGVLVAASIAMERRSDLTKPYAFTEEYQLVRSHLAPGAVPQADCTLMTFNAIAAGDIDIHDFAQVVPGIPILDCRRTDCVAKLSNGGCFYYVRSAACYLNEGGIPAACRAAGVTASGDRFACMNERSASFEQAVDLQPVETRTIGIRQTFDDDWRYPDTAEIGLFRVHPKAGAGPSVAATGGATLRPPFSPEFHEQAMSGDEEPVLPPGEEDVLAAMLGRGVLLVGDCRLSAADIGVRKVDATYACGQGDVEIELTHPSRVAAAMFETDRVAVVLRRGTPPAGFAAALEARVRAAEVAFKWAWLPPPPVLRPLIPLAASGLLAGVIVALALRRRRRG